MYDTIKLKTIAISVCVVFLILGIGAYFCYEAGYEKAEDKYKLEMSDLGRKHDKAIIEAQEKEKEKYAKELKESIKRANDLERNYADRLRQLQNKLRSQGNLESFSREREDCLRLAIEGEKLLNEANDIIESLR